MKTAPVTSIFLFTTLGLLTRPAHGRHGLQSTVVDCRSDTDCVNSRQLSGGETCHWLYDGCSVGQCICDPVRQKRCPKTGKCINARLGGDSCSVNEECPDSMVCSSADRLCQCSSGHMTKDRQYCLHRRHKLLGHTCSSLTDTCYQKAVYGYTTNEVECSNASGRCECTEGWRRDGISCGNRKLYERGCTKLYQCEGGAICKDELCVCPHGFISASPDDKRCIQQGAVRDLPIGSDCDEIYERRYCAKGLVCHRCMDSTDSAFTCVRFRISALIGDMSYYSTGTSLRTSTPWLWTSCALLTVSSFVHLRMVFR